MPVFLLSEKIIFPPPDLAGKDGLLAIGGDLGQQRLLLAYHQGVFPWYSEGDPILWWSPDPRLVLFPNEIKVSRSLRKTIKKGIFRVTMDTAFERVIKACAQVRRKRNDGTWIVEEMIRAYCQLHEAGFAHSVETWYEGNLAGGLYGVSLGKVFFGESMFAYVNNASKVALVALGEYLSTWSFDMIDCQVITGHMIRFGARELPRKEFLKHLEKSMEAPTRTEKWTC
ncbi:leucyl/phenylalanyl-tRNA--protein transferase [Thermodesulfobacteriota bacterium]